MARKLSQITNKISGFLKTHYGNRKICKDIIICKQGKLQIPDTVLITYTIGKAEFDLRFYHYLINKNFIHPHSQSRLYKLLINNRSNIQQIIEHANALKYFNISYEKGNTSDYIECCFACYCILIAISENQRNPLSNTLTMSYYKHFLPTMFSNQSKSNDIEKLGKEITSIIAKKWNKKLSLKESYQVQEDEVDFTLLAMLEDKRTVELIRQQGKRLKPTRIQSYKKLLMQLQSDYYYFPKPE